MTPDSENEVPEEPPKREPITLRAAKIRFRRHMQGLAVISKSLSELKESLPAPGEEEVRNALSPEGAVTDGMFFRGTLQAIQFLVSEAVLLAENERRFARSRAKTFTLDDRVWKGMKNATWRLQRSPDSGAGEYPEGSAVEAG